MELICFVFADRALPEQFLDVPYAPFGKSDRIGRAADFTAPVYFQNRSFREFFCFVPRRRLHCTRMLYDTSKIDASVSCFVLFRRLDCTRMLYDTSKIDASVIVLFTVWYCCVCVCFQCICPSRLWYRWEIDKSGGRVG